MITEDYSTDKLLFFGSGEYEVEFNSPDGRFHRVLVKGVRVLKPRHYWFTESLPTNTPPDTDSP